MTEAPARARAFPPNDIAEAAFELDGVVFDPDGRFERAHRGLVFVGELVLDDNRFWFARKPINGVLSDWQFMRCVHEARAFIVSRVRQ